eukprot:scaffold137283_cov59-Attheya_sp.AAC.1
MAQGGSFKKSAAGGLGGKKKKMTQTTAAKKKKTVTKGWKTHKAKGRKVAESNQEAHTSKAICRKNEAMASARAQGAGHNFFLTDIIANGKKTLNEQNRARNKREAVHKRKKCVTGRLEEQLKKL